LQRIVDPDGSAEGKRRDVQSVSGAAPNGPPVKVDGRGGITWVGGDSTTYDTDFMIHAVQHDPATGAASGTIYVRTKARDAPGPAIWWRVGVTHLFAGWSGGFGIAGVIQATNSPLGETGGVGNAIAVMGSASAENGDTIFIEILPRLEDALGVAQSDPIARPSLTWGGVTIR
jgi:hypothetical protein